MCGGSRREGHVEPSSLPGLTERQMRAVCKVTGESQDPRPDQDRLLGFETRRDTRLLPLSPRGREHRRIGDEDSAITHSLKHKGS